MSGTRTDEDSASVKITDQTKAFERAATTDDDGFFIVTQVSPSSYKINIRQSGFAAAQTNIVLNVNDQRTLRIELKAASATACRAVVIQSCGV